MLETGIKPDFITVDGAEGGNGRRPHRFLKLCRYALGRCTDFRREYAQCLQAQKKT